MGILTESRRQRRVRESYLTNQEVLDICEAVRSGEMSCREAAAHWGITQTHCSKILKGHVRKSVVREPVHIASVSISKRTAQRMVNLMLEGRTQAQIRELFKVSISTIRRIETGDMYPDITGIPEIRAIRKQKTTKRLDYDICKEIIAKVEAGGRSQVSIAKDYNVTPGYITHIVRGRVYKDLKIRDGKSPCGRKKVAHTKLSNDKRDRDARKQGMVYNKYGMLVPVGSEDE